MGENGQKILEAASADGRRNKKRKKALKLTQEELAFKVGISRAYIGYIEQGRNIPSLELLQKIANALKVPLKELF